MLDSPSASQSDESIQQGAGLPPWQETFLARYPRKVKIGLVMVFVVLIISVHGLVSGGGEARRKPAPTTVIYAADKMDEATPPVVTSPRSNREHSYSPESPALNAQDNHDIKVADVDMSLIEDGDGGGLPKVSADGRKPWQAYARPFNKDDKRPRIALVVADLGMTRGLTDAVINRMPANVTLVFDAQSPAVNAWCARARLEGHEVLLDLPMEPFDYPLSDPGPKTILSTLPMSDNLGRLNMSLRKASGYIGVTTFSGSRLSTDTAKMGSIIDVLGKRGLLIFDARVSPHSALYELAKDRAVPAVEMTRRLDVHLTPEAIDQALAALEDDARAQGVAVGVVIPSPVMLDRIQLWLKGLDNRGIALAPLSALVL